FRKSPQRRLPRRRKRSLPRKLRQERRRKDRLRQSWQKTFRLAPTTSSYRRSSKPKGAKTFITALHTFWPRLTTRLLLLRISKEASLAGRVRARSDSKGRARARLMRRKWLPKTRRVKPWDTG